MNPRKKRRIEELLRRELSNIVLYELKDPRTGFVTITRVELSGDQRSAEVLLTVRGPQEQTSETLAALRHARGYIQGLIGERLVLRYTPVLSFSEDSEVREAMRIEELIDRARREDREFRS
ncbi:MAG: 30S ribosome-binding factor RbfA [Candidatus Brocadiaceae bacterium]|jgi:ribosome-binding factor A